MGLFISLFKLNQYVGLTLTSNLLTQIAPEVFLTIFLPGLLFEGAMNLDTEKLFRNIKTISSFAIIGVLLTVLIAATVFHYVLNVPWQISLLFAAMIAPTDPIAVLSIFKKLGVPKKLSMLLEGESLFNDGTGIVIFRVILGLILTSTFSLTNGVAQFLKVVLGGLILGGAFGYVIARIITKIEDNFIQITLTTIVTYGSFLTAEHLGFSGVIAVVVAGIIVGELGIKKLSPQSKLDLMSFWTYVGFLLNSFVFLLIGLEINVQHFAVYFSSIVVAFLAVLIGRGISIYFISHIINKIDDSKLVNNIDEHIPGKWQHILVWGGLHGGLSMVLALSLPTSNTLLLEWRPFLLTTVFGVVFLSLVFQGTTIAPLLKFLGLSNTKEKHIDYEIELARQYMYHAGEHELTNMKKSKTISRSLYTKYMAQQHKELENSEKLVSSLLKDFPELKKDQIKEIETSLLAAYKNALIEGYKKRRYSKETMNILIAKINQDLVELREKSN